MLIGSYVGPAGKKLYKWMIKTAALRPVGTKEGKARFLNGLGLKLQC